MPVGYGIERPRVYGDKRPIVETVRRLEKAEELKRLLEEQQQIVSRHEIIEESGPAIPIKDKSNQPAEAAETGETSPTSEKSPEQPHEHTK